MKISPKIITFSQLSKSSSWIPMRQIYPFVILRQHSSIRLFPSMVKELSPRRKFSEKLDLLTPQSHVKSLIPYQLVSLKHVTPMMLNDSIILSISVEGNVILVVPLSMTAYVEEMFRSYAFIQNYEIKTDQYRSLDVFAQVTSPSTKSV